MALAPATPSSSTQATHPAANFIDGPSQIALMAQKNELIHLLRVHGVELGDNLTQSQPRKTFLSMPPEILCRIIGYVIAAPYVSNGCTADAAGFVHDFFDEDGPLEPLRCSKELMAIAVSEVLRIIRISPFRLPYFKLPPFDDGNTSPKLIWRISVHHNRVDYGCLLNGRGYDWQHPIPLMWHLLHLHLRARLGSAISATAFNSEQNEALHDNLKEILSKNRKLCPKLRSITCQLRLPVNGSKEPWPAKDELQLRETLSLVVKRIRLKKVQKKYISSVTEYRTNMSIVDMTDESSEFVADALRSPSVEGVIFRI